MPTRRSGSDIRIRVGFGVRVGVRLGVPYSECGLTGRIAHGTGSGLSAGSPGAPGVVDPEEGIDSVLHAGWLTGQPESGPASPASPLPASVDAEKPA
jgi:hypothetical protein